MDETRSRQFRIWRRWTPQERLAAMGRMTATALVLRDRRLTALHPGADAAVLRELSIRATLSSSPSGCLP